MTSASSSTRRSVAERLIRRRRARAAGWAAIVVLGAFSALTGSVSGASPAPSSSGDGPASGTDSFWLDEPLTPDAPAGGVLGVAFTVWDPQADELAQLTDVYIRLHPASGKARPTTVAGHLDWPGHFSAPVTVPKGGVGELEVGVHADGRDVAFVDGGVGPPPDASVASLVDARVHEPRNRIVAGEPADLIVDLIPRVNWPPDKFALPDRLIVIVNQARGPDVANSELRPGTAGSGSYTGDLIVPEAGDFMLVVAVPANGREDQILEGSEIRISVAPGRGGDAPAAPVAAGASGPAPPWALIAGTVVAVGALGLVIRRVFADL